MSCEGCAAIEALVRRAVAPMLQGATPASSPAPMVPIADFDARLRLVVQRKRAYERDLPQTDEDTVEHEHQKGLIAGMQMAIDTIVATTGIKIDDPPPPKKRAPKVASISSPVLKASKDAGDLSPTATAVLRVAVARRGPSTNAQLAVLAGYSETSGGFSSALGELRSRGLLSGSSKANVATPEGIAHAGAVEPLPSGRTLLEVWAAKLDPAPAKILRCAVSRAAQKLSTSNEALAEHTLYSQTSGGFSSALGVLRRLKLIEKKTNHPAPEFLR